MSKKEIYANNKDKNDKPRKSKKILEGKCLFPFKYKNNTYNECVKGETGEWCATSLTKKGFADNWGYCYVKENQIEKSSSKKTFKKPRGRNPKNKVWNYEKGIWENKSKKNSSSYNKHSSPSSNNKFDREKRINELKNVCIDPYDAILYEDFEDWEDEDLMDAILIGPENAKRCYQVENIYKWMEENINSGKPIRDPINTAHELTLKEINNIKEIMKKRLGSKYTSPENKKIVLDEKNVELVISDPNETWMKIQKKLVPYYHKPVLRYPFFHIQIKITIPSQSQPKYIDLGYIPAGIEPLPGQDQYLSSYSLITSVRKLWDMRKLLTVHHPLKKIKCCSVSLKKKPYYWFNNYGQIDIQKVSDMGEELRYQELM